ncbi:MAG: type II toxin-antitoxin system VapC family toxin [Chloroflexales bacterium]
MRYVLDTTICIALIRKKPLTVLAHLTKHPITDIALSSITIAELQFGVSKSTVPHQNQQALDQFLLPFTFLDVDYPATSIYGTIRAFLEAQGTPIGALDTLIAAQAIAHNLILVTNNTREFMRVPNLVLEDWTKP